MTIAGFNLKKILVEKKGLVRGEVKVDSKINISDIKKQDIKITSGKDVISFEFDFIITYLNIDNKNNIAEVLFEGNVLYLGNPKETKKILDEWKKKNIPTEIRVKIMNTILTKCNIKALVLEEDLGLPAHIPLPKFGSKEKETKPKKK